MVTCWGWGIRLNAASSRIYVCAPCMKAHSVEADDLIEGAQPGGSALLLELAEGATVFSY